ESADIEIEVPPLPPPPVPAADVAAVVAEEPADADAAEAAVAAEAAEDETSEPEAVATDAVETDVETDAIETEAGSVATETLEPETAEPETAAPAASVIEPTPLEHVPAVLTVTDVDPAQAALVLRGVSKSFGGALAVDGVDLTVPAGTFYGLVGPNGAGKTTTLSMISGLLRPDRGSVHVTGIDVRANPRGAKRRMGVLPDRLRTFDRLTGRQLLYYYGVLRGLPAAVV